MMMIPSMIVTDRFTPLDALLRGHAEVRGCATALIDETRSITWKELDRLLDRVAWALQRDGVQRGELVAIASANSIEAVAAFLGALRAGAVPTPLTSSASANTLHLMLKDSRSRILLHDGDVAQRLLEKPAPEGVTTVALDSRRSNLTFDDWIGTPGARPADQPVSPEDPFNVIYSSGTTGTPKGIVQSHGMRHEYARRMLANGGDASTVAIASTPLYSNTTLVALLPTLAAGGKVVLMRRFDVELFLALSERERVTDAMLVPAQYRRIMEHESFDRYDLSSYRMKSSTSAPFPAWLKAEVLRRWPGGLIERYGMTEGGASTTLFAHQFPDKLHTVGQVNPGHSIKIIGDDGSELPPGATGEIVGRSPLMMSGYLNRPDATREAEWIDADGRRYIRHGDIGRFDEDGFLILMDRSKDLIISGGFNIYPSDIEAELTRIPGVREAAVVGVPSERWGETPVAVIVIADGADAVPARILEEANGRLGKTQRIAAIETISELPQSSIGKVLKRELRDWVIARNVSRKDNLGA